jgi:hypothetical protein
MGGRGDSGPLPGVTDEAAPDGPGPDGPDAGTRARPGLVVRGVLIAVVIGLLPVLGTGAVVMAIRADTGPLKDLVPTPSESSIDALENNWPIHVPDGAKVVVDQQGDRGFEGDGASAYRFVVPTSAQVGIFAHDPHDTIEQDDGTTTEIPSAEATKPLSSDLDSPSSRVDADTKAQEILAEVPDADSIDLDPAASTCAVVAQKADDMGDLIACRPDRDGDTSAAETYVLLEERI